MIAALQLLSWLLFRPSAWHQQIRRIAPGLSPNFTLLELSRAQWRDPTLRRILRLIYLLWPMLVTLLVAVILGSMGSFYYMILNLASDWIWNSRN